MVNSELSPIVGAYFCLPALVAGIAMARLRRWVGSDLFACPGGHPDRPLTDAEREVFEEDFELPSGVRYVEMAECRKMIEVHLEVQDDGEGGHRVSYAVAVGTCAEALMLESDPERLAEHPLIGEWMERRRTRAILDGRDLGRLEDLEW